MSAPRLAVIAAELYRDLQEIGFGECPHCSDADADCDVWNHADRSDREVSGTDLVDLMGRYFERLEEASNRAVGRPARQEALPLD